MADLLDRAVQAAQAACRLVPLLEGAAVALVAVSENVVLQAHRDGAPLAALRVPRPGYRTMTELASELAWLAALDAAGLGVPRPLAQAHGVPGLIDTEDGLVVAVSWTPGEAGGVDGDDPASFERLGEIAARLQQHARRWRPPPWFRRWRWDGEALVGPSAHWGSYQLACTSSSERRLMDRAAELAARMLAREDTMLLVHSDLRAANVVRTPSAELVPIDFDDAGFAHPMADLAGALSFLEDDPRRDERAEAWLRGYGRLASIDERWLAVVWPLVVARRLALTGWSASRVDSEVASTLGRAFVEGTLAVCDAFLAGRMEPLEAASRRYGTSEPVS